MIQVLTKGTSKLSILLNYVVVLKVINSCLLFLPNSWVVILSIIASLPDVMCKISDI